MPSRFGIAVTLLLLVALLGVPLVAAEPEQDTRLSVQPPAGTFLVGEEIAVIVQIEDVQDLYGVDVQLEFDAQRLSVVDALPAWPGVQVLPLYDWFHPDFIVRNAVTYTLGTTGTIWFAASQMYPTLPVSGTGAVLSFTAQAVTPGDTWVRFKRWQLADSNAMPISATAAGAIFHIGQSRQIYLPLVVVDR